MEDKKIDKSPVIRRTVTVAAAAAIMAVGPMTAAFGATTTNTAGPDICPSTVRTVGQVDGKILTRITPARTGPAASCDNGGCTNNGSC